MRNKTKKRSLIARVFRLIAKVFFYGFILSIFYVLLCKWVNPPITITQIGSVIQGDGLQRDYVSYDEMSSSIKLAVLAGEDQLFPDHNGFDFKSIEKARKHNQKSKSLHGASTISQQVAKNVFLWQHGGYFRKGLEVYFTFMIETLWSKKRILETYLNVIEMGRGVYGIEAASQYYFKKSAKNLTLKEASLIAACLPNPKTYTIKPMSSRVSFRSQWILFQIGRIQGDDEIQQLIK